MPEDYDYFINKRPDRVYLSRAIETRSWQQTEDGEVVDLVRPIRIVSKVIDCKESHRFIKDGKKTSLRITPGERQEITAKFYEDSRGVFTLQIQKYTRKSGTPHNTHFTFTGREISTLYNFLRNVAVLPLRSQEGAKLDDRFIDELILTREQAVNLLLSQPGLLEEVVKHQPSTEEIVALGRRKSALDHFDRLLHDPDYFNDRKTELGANKRDEDVWQDFFERNTWIFGYGLTYIFNSPLEGKRLEQVVKGFDFQAPGKRVDGLLKTAGLISSLSFGEIKTHTTPLIADTKAPYRSASWSISRDLANSIAQVQRTVQVSVKNLQTKTEIKASDGSLTGEQLYLYNPKSFLVIGSLQEFQGEVGINEEKYSSFELFRRSMHSPEVLTFDELYERARYIVATTGTSHDRDT